ncbi:MAG: ATP-binding protein [Planctomycetes bacterium]|nr:ATP-binding protein [Planctomycetota bacterium]
MGKTWLVESVLREHIGEVATLNLERHPRSRDLFADPSPRKNLAAIEVQLGRRIEPGKCVLFLDEVQVVPEVLARLRYFHEELPELHVVAAGSLLDFALAHHTSSMPVGRVEYLYLEPLSFAEFIAAVAGEVVLDAVRQWQPGVAIPRPVHEKLLGLCREYAMVGGMPAVVERYRTTQSMLDVARLQHDLVTAFRDDFTKYGTRVSPTRLQKVLHGAARQVGGKFVYADVDREERAVHLREALDCLVRARVCHRVPSVHGNGIPFAAEANEKEFKVMLLDTGLLLAAQGLSWQQHWDAADLMLVHEGAVAEHLVGQMLRTVVPRFVDPELFYWTRHARNSQAEVDYLFGNGPEIVPIEVKAGKSGTLRSLHQFVSEKGSRLAVRVSSEPPHLAEVKTTVPGSEPKAFQLLSIPFYLVGELPRVLAALAAPTSPRASKRRRSQGR